MEKSQVARYGIDQYPARNLRQRLSPKAEPSDSGNTDQEKRQAGFSASVEQVAMLIPSRDFLLSFEPARGG